MAVLDDKIKDEIAKHGNLKVILSVLFAVLSYGKAKLWFSKK